MPNENAAEIAQLLQIRNALRAAGADLANLAASLPEKLSAVERRVQSRIEHLRRQDNDSGEEFVLDAEISGVAASLSDHLSELERLHQLWDIDIRMATIARRIASPGRNPDTMPIDVICANGIDLELVRSRYLLLDERALDQFYQDSPHGINLPKGPTATEFLDLVSYRVARRLGRRFAERLDLPASVLAEAWWYRICNELHVLIPARHCARRIAKACQGQAVLIPLESPRFYFAGGGKPNIELFYLAAMLQSCGITVAFLCSNPEMAAAAEAQQAMVLRFEPDPQNWVLQELPETSADSSPDGRAAIVGAAIRGFDYIFERVRNPLRIRSPFIMENAFGHGHESLYDSARPPVALVLTLLPSDPTPKTHSRAVTLSAALPTRDLGEFCFTVLGSYTRAVYAKAIDLVRRHNIEEAHVCDMPTLEGTVLCHAVERKGGKIVFWPHSSNTVLHFLRRPDQVYCTLNATARRWTKSFPGLPVTVVSDMWLACEEARQPIASKPLSVVIMGNDPNVGRVANVAREAYAETWRQIFARLDGLAPDIQYFCKPRSLAGLSWMQHLSGNSPHFGYTVDHPLVIDLPNMIFLFPVELSNALIDGIGRGIPSMLVTDGANHMRQYLDVGLPDCVPAGDVDFITAEIERCRDPAYMLALTEAQLAWYRSETNFPAPDSIRAR